MPDANLPLAPRGRSWDGDAARSRMLDVATDAEGNINVREASRGFAIIRGDSQNRTSYILPFADMVAGRKSAVFRGIAAAIGALRGARDGVKDISDAQRQRALSFLEGQRRRFDDDNRSEDMELKFTTNSENGTGDAVVASSGMTSRNHDFFSGKPFRVVPAGIRTDNFALNPVLLWQHDADEPIGRADTFMERGRLMARPEFHEITEKSQVVSDLWRGKFLNAVSVRLGLSQSDVDSIVETDTEIVLPASELVELSVVTLPGDAGAVRQFLQSRQSSYGEAATFILQSFEAHSNSEVNEMDQNELIEETGAEPTAEALVETAPNDDVVVPFELDNESVQQLTEGLGINALAQQLAELADYTTQLEQRIAELEGEPVIKNRVGPTRFSFTSAKANRQSPPDSIPTPRASRPNTAASRQIARMSRAK